DDESFKIRNLAVGGCPRMQNDKLEVGHHTVLVKRGVRTCQVDFAGVGHFVNDLVEDEVDPVIGLESELYTNKETPSRNYGIDDVLAGERTIHCIDVNEPVDIGTLRSFLENGVNDV